MKKITILLLAAVLSIGSMTAEVYSLAFGKTSVTSDNCANILNDRTASYDPATNTLTLNGVDKTFTEMDGLMNGIKGLKVLLKGKNVIKVSSDNGYGLLNKADIKFVAAEKGASISFSSLTSYAVYTRNSNITFDGAEYGLSVRIISASTGVIGSYQPGLADSAKPSITVRNADLQIDMTNNGAMTGIYNLNLEGCHIAQPAGATFDANKQCVVDRTGATLTSALVIEMNVYDLKIGGIEVSVLNQKDVLKDGGSVKYDEVSNTLALNNAVVRTNEGNGIYSNIPGIKVTVKGYNSFIISGAVWHGLFFIDDATIEAVAENSAIYVSCSSNPAVLFRNGTLTIDGGRYGLDFSTSSSYGSIQGNHIYNAVKKPILVLRNITGELSGGGDGTITEIDGLTLDGCKLAEPERAEYSASKRGVVDATGKLTTATIKIEYVDKYGIFVCGVQVTSENANNITHTGPAAVWYDVDANTLYITSDLSYNGDVVAIYQNCTIYVDRNVTLDASSGEGSAIVIDAADYVTILCKDDRYKLTLKSSKGVALSSEVPLTITGGMPVAIYSSDNYAIGMGGSPMTISTSTVAAIGNGKTPTFVGCSQFNMRGLEIRSPHTYDMASSKFLTANNEEAKDNIVIGPVGSYGVFVEGEQVTDENAADVLKNGEVSFDAATNTLTLKKATVRDGLSNGIELRYGDYTINCIDSCQVIAWSVGICSYFSNVTIKGDVLSLYGGEAGVGFTQPGYNLTIADGVSVTTEAYEHPLNLGNGTLTVDNATLTARFDRLDSGAATTIAGCTDLQLINTTITTGQTFDPSTQNFVESTGLVANGQIVIDIVPPTNYPVAICGNLINENNCNDVLNDGGSVKYSPTTNTLTLTNANINATGVPDAISAYRPVLIYLVGENKVSTSSVDALGVGVNLEQGGIIMGDGSLTINAGVGLLSEEEVMLSGCTLYVTGSMTGINLTGESLVIAKANVSVQGNDVSIAYVGSFTIANSVITSAHAYDETTHKFLDAQGNEANDRIVIEAVASGVETIDNAPCTMRKYIRDGQICIEKNGRTYNVLGTVIE